MTAMVGVLLSLVTPVPGPVALPSNICVGADVCQLLEFAQNGNDGGDGNNDGSPDGFWAYATPAEVDCRALRLTAPGTAAAGRNDLDSPSGACNQPAWDLRYRVSRFPDGERPNGAFGPQRARGVVRTATTFTQTWRGLPHEAGSAVFLSLPPVAVYAQTHGLGAPPFITRLSLEDERQAPFRVIEPPERPPRA